MNEVLNVLAEIPEDSPSFFEEFNSFWGSLLVPQNLVKVVNKLLIIAIGVTVCLLVKLLLKNFFKLISKNATNKRKTLATVCYSTLKYLTYFVMICIILDQFGINATTLITVAGVGSLAIGFGAQSLVKDVITGVFILTEDQFNVGDIIELNGKTGEVEYIGLRITKFRNVVNSEVYIVPNSEIRLLNAY